MTGKILSLITFGILLPLQCLAANVNISLNPSAATLTFGDHAFVDIVGTYDGIGKLLGGAISLNYRADMLQVVGVTLKASSDVGGTVGSVLVSGTSGTVSGIGFATFSGVTGTFDLATVEFMALGTSGNGILSAFDPGDPVYAWVNEVFDSVSVISTPTSITVSAVPEATSMAMLLAGLGVLGAVVHSKHRRSSRPYHPRPPQS